MKIKNLLAVILLINLLFSASCKKDHAVIVVTIQNYTVEYTFWSASYEVKWKEATDRDCTVVQDVLTIVDANGTVAYSRTIPIHEPLPGCASKVKSYSGLLIGPYALSLYPKPVKLVHTVHYTDDATGESFTSSGERVIHEN